MSVPGALAALALGVALGGCMRSGALPTDELDCAAPDDAGPDGGVAGVLVIEQSSAICVYLDTPPAMCPVALPNRFARDGAVACARQARPAAGLIEAAVARARAGDMGIEPADGGIRIVDRGSGEDVF